MGTGTGKAVNGSFKLDTAGSVKVWGYNSDTVVYYIDADDNLYIRSVADLEDDDTDTFVAIKGHKDDYSKGAGTIVALFVREVADPCTGPHTYGDWSVSGGNHVRTCSVCGSTDSHAASFGAWSVVASGDDAGKHTHSCSGTGCTVTETHARTGGDWKTATGAVTGGSAAVTSGQHYQECGATGCNLAYSGGHAANWGPWSGGTDVGDTHTRTCNDCSLDQTHAAAGSSGPCSGATSGQGSCTVTMP